ncbi:MAG TPA: GDP-L-fucose synthase family protein [Cyclobacteriaceae bacterium]
MKKGSKIYIAGHRGMVGSALFRNLSAKGFDNLITRTSKELDLTLQSDVNQFFSDQKPEYIFMAAAKVGGIQANNTYRADFLYENLMIQNNIIHAAYQNRATKLMFLGSSCIYPKLAPQPLKEEYLLTGLLEHTNEPYAIAKIAGIKLCEAYRDQHSCNFYAVMPTNLYGPNDNYHLQNSHVLPALIRKFHEAKVKNEQAVEIWGTGTPLREFMHVDDLAEACIYLMQHIDANDLEDNIPFLNIGWGDDLSIKSLALMIKEIVGFEGGLKFNTAKPDGTARKLMDTARLNKLGFKPKINLEEGIKQTYADFTNYYLKYTKAS